MRDWILKLLIFSALLGVCQLGLLFVAANGSAPLQAAFRRHTNVPPVAILRGQSTLLRFREIDSYADVDVLFVGSSHCYRAFDPRVFATRGHRSFNMGSTTQTPLNSYYLLERYLDRLSPELLLVEVYWGTLAADGLESLLDLSANLPVTSEMWRMALAIRDLRAINALASRALDLRSGPLSEARANLAPIDTYVPGGFVERQQGYRSRDAPIADARSQRPPNDLQLDYLERIIELARGAGSRVGLVLQPVTKARQRSLPGLAASLARIEAFAAEQAVPFLDLNSWMELRDEQHFYDYHHLNQQGVALFNDRLLDELEQRALLGQRH